MEAIKRSAVVRNGRITVDVPVTDGTRVDVVLIPVRAAEAAERILEEARKLREKSPARAPDPDTLKKWIEEGRS